MSRRTINEGTYPSLSVLIQDIARQVSEYGTFAQVPAAAVGNTRNDMYLVSEAIRFLMKDKENDLSKDDVAKLSAYKKSLDSSNQIHSAVGQGRGRDRAWPWDHSRLEAHRHHRRREDRPEPYDLRPGRFRGVGCRRNDRRRRCVRVAGLDHACVVIRCRWDDGCQRLGIAMVHSAQHADSWVLTLPAAITLSASLYVLFLNIF